MWRNGRFVYRNGRFAYRLIKPSHFLVNRPVTFPRFYGRSIRTDITTPNDNDTAAFAYCLCLLMVEAGRMRLVSKTPGDDGPLCHFHSADGEVFLVPEPALTAAQLTQLKTILYQIWLEGGGESGEAGGDGRFRGA